jgi:hypothetical protein
VLFAAAVVSDAATDAVSTDGDRNMSEVRHNGASPALAAVAIDAPYKGESSGARSTQSCRDTFETEKQL